METTSRWQWMIEEAHKLPGEKLEAMLVRGTSGHRTGSSNVAYFIAALQCCYKWREHDSRFFIDNNFSIVIKIGRLQVDDNQRDVIFKRNARQDSCWVYL